MSKRGAPRRGHGFSRNPETPKSRNPGVASARPGGTRSAFASKAGYSRFPLAARRMNRSWATPRTSASASRKPRSSGVLPKSGKDAFGLPRIGNSAGRLPGLANPSGTLPGGERLVPGPEGNGANQGEPGRDGVVEIARGEGKDAEENRNREGKDGQNDPHAPHHTATPPGAQEKAEG